MNLNLIYIKINNAHDKDAQDLILNALTELLGANHGFSFNKKGVMKHSGSKEHRNDKKNYPAPALRRVPYEMLRKCITLRNVSMSELVIKMFFNFTFSQKVN